MPTCYARVSSRWSTSSWRARSLLRPAPPCTRRARSASRAAISPVMLSSSSVTIVSNHLGRVGGPPPQAMLVVRKTTSRGSRAMPPHASGPLPSSSAAVLREDLSAPRSASCVHDSPSLLLPSIFERLRSIRNLLSDRRRGLTGRSRGAACRGREPQSAWRRGPQIPLSASRSGRSSTRAHRTSRNTARQGSGS